MTNTNNIPTVGTPATIRIGSDRYAAEIVKVSPSGAKLEVQYTGADRERRTFWRNAEGNYQDRGRRLVVGEAVQEMCREF